MVVVIRAIGMLSDVRELKHDFIYEQVHNLFFSP